MTPVACRGLDQGSTNRPAVAVPHDHPTSAPIPNRLRSEQASARAAFLDGDIFFGLYDPRRLYTDFPGLDVELIYVAWQEYETGDIIRTAASAMDVGRRLMVTVEPYTRAVDWRAGGGPGHLSDIVAGEFDPELERVCRDIGTLDQPVMVRWGHEMEAPGDRYPWHSTDGADFIAAYRYFVEHCRAHAPAALYVWSPRGDDTLDAYYPGPDVVDIVGVSVFSLYEFEVDYFGYYRTFGGHFYEKYSRVEDYGHPVIVAEMGAASNNAVQSPQIQRHWFASMCRHMDDFPLLEGVVYFNEVEPWYWPDGYGSPDWRIDPAMLLCQEQSTSSSAR